MIAQFVDDLLHTIGEATIDELRELFAEAPEHEPLFVPKIEPKVEPLAPTPALPQRAARVARLDHAAAFRRSVEATLSAAAPPPAVAEITDPESLLSLGGPNGLSFIETFRPAPADSPPPPPPISVTRLERVERVERTARTGGQAEIDFDSPASGVRPITTISTVRLSENETLARVSNSGVVIRRKKKA